MASQTDTPCSLPPRPIVSRRHFVTVAAAGVLAGSSLLIGCRRNDTPDDLAKDKPLPPDQPRDDSPTLPAEEPLVRVRVGVVRDGSAPLHIGSEGQWIRLAQTPAMLHGVALVAPLTVISTERGWMVADGRGFPAPLSGFGSLLVQPLSPDELGEGLRLDRAGASSAHYPGSLHLVNHKLKPGSGYDVVNHVALERYLPGVIARELYNHWHEETHAAQAIAARSFACAEHEWFRNRRHFDMTNTQASQVYAGTVRHRRSIEAAQQTRGMVLAHNDTLVPGYYSSCCGGLAARAVDAIGPNPINNIRPLHGRSGTDVCTSLPVARWTNERPRAALTRRLVVYGEVHSIPSLQEIAEITSIEVSAMNVHGRPTQYLITDQREKSVQIDAEVFRRAANFTGRGLARPARALRSSFFDAEVGQRRIALHGHGFGHGVGMCQHGAQILAASGTAHDAILKWYYPEAKLAKAYG